MVKETSNSGGGQSTQLEQTQLDEATMVTAPTAVLEDATQGMEEVAKPAKVEKKEVEIKNVKGDSKEKKNEKKGSKETTGGKQPTARRSTSKQPKNKSQKSPKAVKGSAQSGRKESAENIAPKEKGSSKKRKKTSSTENQKSRNVKSAYLCPAKPTASPSPSPAQFKRSAEAVAASKSTAKNASKEKLPLTSPAKPKTITAPRPSSGHRRNQPSKINGSKRNSQKSNKGSEKTSSRRKRATAQAKKLFRKVSSRSGRKQWGTGRAGLEASKRSSRCNKNKKAFFHAPAIIVDVDKDWDRLDVVFSYGMVVRSIGKLSPLLDYLLIGDQLIGIGSMEAESNTMPLEPKNVEDALKEAKGSQLMITVIRPMGMRHCGGKEIPKRRDDCMYFIAELPSNMKPSDLMLEYLNGKTVVTRAEGTVGNVLMKEDRILEYNGQSTAKHNKQETLNAMISQHLATQSKSKDEPVTCLVERSIGAPINAGLNAAVKKNQQPIPMGDDAREIGAREACRFRHYTDFTTTVAPIAVTKTSTEKKSDERMTKKQRFGFTDKKEYSTTPSDVEDTATLARVTPGSGLVKFLGIFRKR